MGKEGPGPGSSGEKCGRAVSPADLLPLLLIRSLSSCRGPSNSPVVIRPDSRGVSSE